MTESDVTAMVARGSTLAALYARRRELPVALAHCFAGTKPTEEKRMGVLNRHYHALDFAGQSRCRAELLDCRTARRNHILRAV